VKDFRFARATAVEDVVDALAQPGTSVIAGGTELLNWMRLGISEPDRVVDIGRIDVLRGIDRSDGELVIGARATLNEVGEHPLTGQFAGALGSACRQAASAQLRNRATLGGNVLQRTRCPYFRAESPVPWPCNKREPGSGCASLAGRHERQAVFGWTADCVAVHPSDPAVALAALDAHVDVAGPNGTHSIPMGEFLLTQAEAEQDGDALRENRLAADELIVRYRLPIRENETSAYVKIRERASYEYAIVSAAASVGLSGTGIVRARIALGSVAQRPWRLPSAERALVGQPLTRDAVLPIVDTALADAHPLPQNGFKVLMARNAAVRALLIAGGAL